MPKMIKNGVWIFFCLLIVGACQEYPGSKLSGKWRGSVLLEEGQPIPVNPEEISFEFSPNGLYQYHGNLNYREAGTFSIKGSLLYTLDTINDASTEKAVKIITLTEDSLFLKMNEDGKERIVKLAKMH